MTRERLQLTSWNLASEKYTDERFWLTGKIWHFQSFHGNKNNGGIFFFILFFCGKMCPKMCLEINWFIKTPWHRLSMRVTRSRSAWIPGIIQPCKQLTVIHDDQQVTHKTKIFLGTRISVSGLYCCHLSPGSVFWSFMGSPSWKLASNRAWVICKIIMVSSLWIFTYSIL